MSDSFSADTDDLDAFTERSISDVRALAETYNHLVTERSVLAAIPLPSFVQHTELGALEKLTQFADENGRYTRDISSALKQYGHHLGRGRFRASAARIEPELDRTDAQRLDRFEVGLVQNGLDPIEAAKVRGAVEKQLDANWSLSFHDATVAGLADYTGMTIAEAEQATRAFGLNPAEIGGRLNQHFDVIASQTGKRDQITIDDLHQTIEDESLPEEVRDVAYRLAADGPLFDKLDVAKQTDLSREPLGSGFNLREVDGIIGREDAAQFQAKNHQAQILLAWHPLLETAGQGYDLTKADSHASEDDVVTFIGDQDIPHYVRLAVFDVYADRYNLKLEQRRVLEEQLALDGGFRVGGTTVLKAVPGGVSGPTLLPGTTTPRPQTAPSPRPGGSGGGGGGGPSPAGAFAAVYAKLLVRSAGAGWTYGTHRRIEQDGQPQVVHIDPLTGRRTATELSELEDLSPAELKAWVAYFSVNGRPPPSKVSQIEPHPYLDFLGHWRMSDTNEPVWPPPDTEDPQPLRIAENPDQYYDGQGNLRWKDTNQLIAHVPTRSKYQDSDGVWRWSDTRRPVDESSDGPAVDSGPVVMNPLNPDSDTVRILREEWGIDHELLLGDLAPLHQLVADAKNKPTGSPDGVGARGELATIRDALDEGKSLELVHNDPSRPTPDFVIEGTITEVKSREVGFASYRWFENKIREAGFQIAKYQQGRGQIEVRLSHEATVDLDLWRRSTVESPSPPGQGI